MTLKLVSAAALGALALAGCTNPPQDSAISSGPTQAPSGITSSNGGGQRQLGNLPSVGVMQGGQTVVTPAPSSKGNAY